MRGPVDGGDFKSYIFPLLFFKRISDVYDEEYVAALRESDGDEEYATFPEQRKFIVPMGAHWKDVREKTENVGQRARYMMRLTFPIRDVGQTLGTWIAAYAGLERVLEITDAPRNVEDLPNARDVKIEKGKLELENARAKRQFLADRRFSALQDLNGL